MTFDATVVQVLIASPSDTTAARDAVERALTRWNASRAETDGVVILPRRYETSAVPAMGADGQQVINRQLVDNADVVIAIFANTLGSATPREVSGTVEEIKGAHAAGKKVHVYFSEGDVPREFADQVALIEEYKREFKGLYGTFTDEADLVEQVRHAIDSDMPEFSREVSRPGRSGANPVARHAEDTSTRFDSKGKPKTVHKHAIVIDNLSDVDAEEFLVEFPGSDANDYGIFFFSSPSKATLYGRASQEYRFERSMAGGSTVEIRMTWVEDGEPRERSMAVNL